MQIIELTGDENITVILNLLQQATDGEVLLFVPKGNEALEKNEVNLKLLRRWADNLALRIALVVEDRGTHVLAKEAGFVLLPSIEAGEKANLHVLDRKRRRRKGLPPPPAPSLWFSTSSRSKTSKRGLKRFFGAGAGLLVAAVVFAALALVLLFIMPGATVVLRPASEAVEAAMQMTGVAGLTEIDYNLAQVPALTVYVEQEGFDTIATTNKRDVPDGYATGTVVFVNKTTTPVTITKGTVVHTSFGQNVRFYTVADTWLPGELYGTVRVSILAAEPGPVGNVSPLTINVVEGELAAQMDVLNNARTSGGTVRRFSTVDGVDKVNLRAKLLKRLQEEAYSELTSGLGADDFIPADSLIIQVLDEEFDHKIDDITNELGMRMTVQVSGLAVSGDEGKELLLTLLQQRMKPGYRLLDDSAIFERGGVIEATPEQAQFSMSVRAAIAPTVDANAVSSAIAGKTIEAAKEYLSRQFKLASEPQIDLTGSFLKRLPWWAARIQVQATKE